MLVNLLGDFFGKMLVRHGVRNGHTLGATEAIRFCRRFYPNKILHIPSPDQTERIARAMHIEKSLRADPSTERVRSLAQFHSTDLRTIAKEMAKKSGTTVMALRAPPRPMRRIGLSRGPKSIRDCSGQMSLFNSSTSTASMGMDSVSASDSD
jgi:hypothetical protein